MGIDAEVSRSIVQRSANLANPIEAAGRAKAKHERIETSKRSSRLDTRSCWIKIDSGLEQARDKPVPTLINGSGRRLIEACATKSIESDEFASTVQFYEGDIRTAGACPISYPITIKIGISLKTSGQMDVATGINRCRDS